MTIDDVLLPGSASSAMGPTWRDSASEAMTRQDHQPHDLTNGCTQGLALDERTRTPRLVVNG